MMKRCAAALCAGACALAFAGWKGDARVHSFSELPRGNVLQIHFHSSGCFNQDDYDFTFRRMGEASVDLVEKDDERAPRSFPRLSLTADDLKKLDATLKYYRAVKGGACTTLDTVKITELHGSRILAIESYQDRTCSNWDEDKNLLTFNELYNRISDTAMESTP